MTPRTIRNWRKADPEFKATDEKNVYELYKEQGLENITHAFMRNFMLIRNWEYRLVNKSLNNPDEMTDAEQKELIDVRGRYTLDQFPT